MSHSNPDTLVAADTLSFFLYHSAFNPRHTDSIASKYDKLPPRVIFCILQKPLTLMKIFSKSTFSQHCPVCLSATEHSGLCENCLSSLIQPKHSCRICLVPIERQAGNICIQCSTGVPFDQVVALARYTPPLSDLICRLKYGNHIHLAKVLGTLLANHIKKHQRTLPELLIAVPLHKQRIQQRGFNQAIEIARTVSAELNLKTDYRCIEKSKITPLQTTLNSHKRRNNLKGAFHLRRQVLARSVALLDDVMTTGATVSEIASLFKKQGVRRVEVWVLARTSPSY